MKQKQQFFFNSILWYERCSFPSIALLIVHVFSFTTAIPQQLSTTTSFTITTERLKWGNVAKFALLLCCVWWNQQFIHTYWVPKSEDLRSFVSSSLSSNWYYYCCCCFCWCCRGARKNTTTIDRENFLFYCKPGKQASKQERARKTKNDWNSEVYASDVDDA